MLHYSLMALVLYATIGTLVVTYLGSRDFEKSEELQGNKKISFRVAMVGFMLAVIIYGLSAVEAIFTSIPQ
jgi:hypothetical protein